MPFVIIVLFRLFEAGRNVKRKGSLLDLENSNWFKRQGTKLMFKRKNLIALIGNVIPNLGILLCMALAFKHAALGGMNQGVLPTLTCLASIFTMVLFYFKFYELISFIQGLGMLIMVISVVFLGLEATAGSDVPVPAQG